MAVKVDYYALLQVDRKADTAAIEAAVKKSMREWRKRTEAAELSVRQEAELKVKQIEEARATLLDQSKRAAYDRALAGGVEQAERPQGAAPDGGTWLDQAEGFLAVGDYHSAAYAARQATQSSGDSARSWWVRSRANAGLHLWQDARYEAKQAVALEENNAEYHFNLGLVHEEMEEYNEAINAFRRAGACDPTNPMYELAVGGIYVSTGHLDKALPTIEAVYRKHPQDENANYYLGQVMLELAESVPKLRSNDFYYVTSAEEIHQMRDFATRAASLNVVNPDIRKWADGMLEHLHRMEQKVFIPPWVWTRGITGSLLEGAGDGGCIILAIVIPLAGAIMFLPLVLLIASINTFGVGNPGVGFILLLLTIGSGWFYWQRSWVPAWKRNKG